MSYWAQTTTIRMLFSSFQIGWEFGATIGVKTIKVRALIELTFELGSIKISVPVRSCVSKSVNFKWKNYLWNPESRYQCNWSIIQKCTYSLWNFLWIFYNYLMMNILWVSSILIFQNCLSLELFTSNFASALVGLNGLHLYL